MSTSRSLSNPGQKALRRGRHSEPNRAYHVTTCTMNKRAWFGDFAVARIVVHAIRREDEARHTRTLAFVVMSDHLHWLVQLSGLRSLSGVVNTVKSFSTRRINKSLSRSGPLWQKGFHDHGIRVDEDLTATARYIVANPLRAGIVERFGEYPLWDAIWL